MATVNLGRVGLVLKGEYDASTKYEKLDVVTYQGSSYIAKQTTTGNAPTNESFWQLQSEKGEKGDKGDAGGGLTRLDDQTPVTVDGVLAGKNGKLAPADFVPAEILPTNTVAQAGIVAAPTANNANSLWSTDGNGNPAWRYYDYQTKAQIQQLIATAISESGHASFEKIDHIPEVEEAKDNILYLVYNTQTAHYDIYAKVVNEQGVSEVLLIDDTTVDLSDYVTNEALEAKDYATNTKLDTAITGINTNLNNKVDKESGKGLSSNDYTADDKSKLEGIEANADVNKIESVKLNGSALPIDEQKAVNIDLSDYATDSELSSGLSGKVDKQEGKQLSTEDFTTAYKNKLDGIPEGGGGGEVNIINTVKVNGTALVPDAEKAVDVKAYNKDNKPEVGGRNLLLNSNGPGNYRPGFGTNYLIASYKLSEFAKDLANGDYVTISGEAELGEGKQYITVFSDHGYTGLVEIHLNDGKFKVTQKWKIGNTLNDEFSVFAYPQSVTTPSVVKWMKLERGEIATDWTPAPEDKQDKIDLIGGRNYIHHSSPELYPNGWSKFGRGWESLPVESGYAVSSGWEGNYVSVLSPISDNKALEYGTYTLSFTAYLSNMVGFSSSGVGFAGGVNGTKLINDEKPFLSTSPKRYEFTFEVSKDTDPGANWRFAVLLYNSSQHDDVTLYLKDAKLEKGNISTDWSPAPEDLEAEIPTKTSELQNDSGFITQADIPEGAAASNTVPKAPAAAGSVGNELAFARGDHVHPMQPGIGNPISIPANADLNDYRPEGAYYCNMNATAATIKNLPAALGAVGFSLLVIVNHANAGVSQILISYRQPAPSFIRNYDSSSGWGEWNQYAYLSSLNASNFTGVLPVEKGGTGNQIGQALSLPNWQTKKITIEELNNRDTTGGVYSIEGKELIPGAGYYNYVIRTSGYMETNKAYYRDIALPYASVSQYPNNAIYTRFWNGDTPSEWLRIPVASELPTIATSSKAGLIKPGTGCEVTSDGTLNVTASGGISEIPVASATTLGGVKIGDNMKVTEDGTVSVDSSNFITSSGGTLNDKAEIALGDQATLKVNDYNGDHRLWLEIKPTESNLNDIEFCLGRYIDFRVDNMGTLVIETTAPSDGFERELHLTGFEDILLNGSPNHRVISSCDYATTSNAGIVKVGSGLSVDGEGTLSVDFQSTTNNFINLKALYVHEAATPSVDPDVNGFTIYATRIFPSRTSEEADVSAHSIINIDSADVSYVYCYFKETPINTAGTLASEDDAQSFLSGSMEFQFNQASRSAGNYGSVRIFINTVLKSSVAKTIVELPDYMPTGTTYAALAEILRSAGITRLQCNGLSKQKLDLYG